jgi:REP element-mobilizing transposase RayT
MRQQAFEFKRWGGKRKGAGRPARGPRSSERHEKRAYLDRNHPVHVTLRVVERVGRLRRRHAYRAVRRAMVAVLERQDFRICHLSIQGNHMHLIVEADGAGALARGMQGFEISCARRLNAALTLRTGRKHRGQVFADRYHPVVLKSPRQVRNALCYVLNNWRRHREDEGRAVVDFYSSGIGFDGWKAPVDRRISPESELLPIKFAHSWLLTRGWRRHGLVSPWERPAPASQRGMRTPA